MKTIKLATMRWPEYDEPICAGTNKEKLVTEAVKILKKEHGLGPVPRQMAMCSVPIQRNDINIWEIPFI